MLKVTNTQNDQDQNVLLIIHDSSGESSTLIEDIILYLNNLLKETLDGDTKSDQSTQSEILSGRSRATDTQ
jgi:hypothetical protein